MQSEINFTGYQFSADSNPNTGKELDGIAAYRTFAWETEEEGSKIWQTLPPETKTGMAATYKEGFAGPPWEERFKCNNQECSATGIFYPKKPESGKCVHCGGTDIGEAYPINELLEKLFPELIGSKKSGVLNIAYDNQEEVIGFAIGGKSTLEKVKKGHYGEGEWPAVCDLIYKQSGLGEKDEIFYIDELVVRPDYQFKKVGSGLASRSMAKAINSGSVICGLTLNGSPILTIRGKQLAQANYDVTRTPLGSVDSYRGPGNRERVWYTARPANAKYRTDMQKKLS